MLSSDNLIALVAQRGRWTARIHYYLGLYFLFFVWLFALTGLLLNHSMWGFAEFQRSRTTTKSEQMVSVPNTGTQLGDAQDLMRQLGIDGEVQWVAAGSDAGRFVFRVARPGRQTEVRVELQTAKATVEQTAVNALGITRALHVFTGVRMNDSRNTRDWLVTRIWALSMDAVAIGLLVMVVTGLLVWLRTTSKLLPGVLVLGAGLVCCAWFVVGVAHLGN
jgi:hypothetical protein